MELQSTQVFIKRECRDKHGTRGALEEAFDIIRKKYLFDMKAEINKNATFTVRLLLDRFDGEVIQ